MYKFNYEIFLNGQQVMLDKFKSNWVFAPKDIIFHKSSNGKKMILEVKKITHDVLENEENAHIIRINVMQKKNHYGD